MVGEALHCLLARENLSRGQARALLSGIFAGEASEAQIAGVLVALAMKGETVAEVVGFAEAMRAAVADIGARTAGVDSVDTCGTGGSARKIFNVSTAAAFVVAGAGQAVAKHGNRTSTSICGSADVLEAAGVDLTFPVEQLGNCLRATGMVFLFAPLLHRAMQRVMPVRRALATRTIFNIVGPLTNPAGAAAQVVGVSSPELVPLVAESLLELGTRHSFVVHGEDGLGEFSTMAPSMVSEIRAGQIRQYRLDARELGLPRAELFQLTCSSKTEALAAMQAVLAGEMGPRRDIVCLNAAAALVAGSKAADLGDGLEMARHSLDSGAARAKLAALVAYTRDNRAGEATASPSS